MPYIRDRDFARINELVLTIKQLSEKLKINYVTPENLDKFREATKPVYQYFIDKQYFSWDDINEVRAYLSK